MIFYVGQGHQMRTINFEVHGELQSVDIIKTDLQIYADGSGTFMCQSSIFL